MMNTGMTRLELAPGQTLETRNRLLKVDIASKEEADFSIHSAATMSQVMDFVLAMDRRHATRNGYRNIAMRIEPLVRFIERYAKAIDTLVQSANGSLLSPITLIWGALRAVLEVASSVTRYFPKLVDLLERLGASVAIYGRYNDLFGNNADFQVALDNVYSQILVILLRAHKTFKKRTRMLLLRSVWATFESDFLDRLERLHGLLATLEQETTLAHRLIVQKALHGIQIHNEVRHGPWTLEEIQDSRKPIMEWLSPMDVDSQLRRFSQVSTNGTGAWLLQDSRFQTWGSEIVDFKGLWIRGPPGAGKTILCSTIIRHLQRHKDPGNTVVFHFCDGLREDVDEVASIYKSFIAQLCLQAEVLPFCLVQAFETSRRYGRRHITSSDSPAALLRSMLAISRNTFLVIDGLDELQDPCKVLNLLQECLVLSPSLHVIGLSRDVEDIGMALSSWPTITIDFSLTRPDIERFVSQTAATLPIDDSELRRTAAQLVLDRSCGMFLWARLAMDALSHATSPAHLLSLAQQVPQGISSVYLGYLKDLMVMDTYTQDLATKILRFVSCSKRPLQLTELQFALSHTLAAGDESAVATHTPFRRSIVALVYPLVTYDHERDEFNFPHVSVREFLLRPPGDFMECSSIQKFFVKEERAAVELASACLSRLKRVNDHGAFSLYATLYWSDHILEAPWSHELQQAVDDFLSEDSRRQEWLSKILFHHRPGFNLQNVVQQQRQLNNWMTSTRRFAPSSSITPMHDWAEDTLAILLRSDLRIDRAQVADPISYFEKLMIVRDLSRLLKQSNKTGKAISTLEKHREVHFPSGTDLSAAWVLNALGILYDQQGESTKSISLHESALSIQESYHGPNHLEPTWTINELGRMYRHVGDHLCAAKHHLRALDVLRRVLPPDHLEIVWTENTLARAERKLGRPALALELHKKAYEVRKRVLGPLHAHTLWVLGDMAQCHRDLGEIEEAVRLHRSALAGRTEALGPKHPDTLWSANDLGVVLAECGEQAEAFALQSSTLTLQSEVLGPHHEHTEWTRREVGKLTSTLESCLAVKSEACS